ncbi:MAG: hypothetical protein K1X57_14900 [Gemmataceae bacterium]|nr:hypothetical protein [Gemmataceae bacterium]
MRWRNIGLLTVALLALGHAVMAQDKPKVDPQEREREEQKAAARHRDEIVRTLHEVKAEFEKCMDELAKARAELAELTGLRDSHGVREVVGPLQIDVQRLRVEVAGLAARKDALEMSIAKAAAQGRDLAAADPIARELRKLVTLRESVLEGFAKDSHDARSVAMAQLVDTRIKLEERIAILHSGAVSNAKFAERLMETTISLAESQARLKQSEVLLAKLRSPQLNMLMEREHNLSRRSDRLSKQIESLESAEFQYRLRR